MSNAIFSQKIPDSVLISELKKNVLAYRIRTDFKLVEHGDNSTRIKTELLRLFPEKGEDLLLDVSNIPLRYPNPNIDLFEVTNFNYEFSRIGSDGEIEIVNNSKEYFDSKPKVDQLSRRMLIGINRKEKSIIYVSGYFYLTKISNDFDLDMNNPDSFIQFLRLKLFNYNMNDFSFVKQRKKYLLYKGYSKATSANYYIRVNKNDFDNLCVTKI